MLSELIHIKHIGQDVVLGEHSVNVSHSDVFQAWGSDSNLMKFTAGKETESKRKGKADHEDRASCHDKAIKQASVSQWVLCEVKGFVSKPVGEPTSPGLSTAGLRRAFHFWPMTPFFVAEHPAALAHGRTRRGRPTV